MSEFNDPFKHVKFEHDGPTDEERADVAAQIEVDAEETDESAGEDGPLGGSMAWEGYESAPLLQSLARIAGLTAFAKDQFAVVLGIIEEGVPDDVLASTLTLGAKDEQVLSYGLNLVGFFCPEMSEAAKSLAERLMDAVEAKEVPEETRSRLEDAFGKMNKRRFAEQFGMTPEELDAAIAEELSREGKEIIGESVAAEKSPTSDVSWN